MLSTSAAFLCTFRVSIIVNVFQLYKVQFYKIVLLRYFLFAPLRGLGGLWLKNFGVLFGAYRLNLQKCCRR